MKRLRKPALLSLILLTLGPGMQFAQTIKAVDPWPRHTIDASSEGADGVKLADINHDGQPDIATGWEEGGITKLYIHPGAGSVRAEWPSVVVGTTPGVEDAVFADLNGDGYPEVVSCTEKGSERIVVHWSPKRKHLKPRKWKQEVLPASEGVMMWMYAEPCQIDGQFGLDLLAAGKGEAAALGWFKAPAAAADLDQWKWHPISPVGWVMSILIRDLDQDGDADIIITDRYGSQSGCRWLENPGPGPEQKNQWNSHLIGAAGQEVMFMTMADLDGDGREEAIVSERTDNTIRIFKPTGTATNLWAAKTIPLPPDSGRAKSVEVGDVNGDGQADLVISTNTYGAQVSGLIWIDGSKLEQVECKPISAAHNAKYDKVELLDLDGDGDLDVLICEENFGENSEGLGLIWYENQLKK